jgi:excisionase family DNA binding protein
MPKIKTETDPRRAVLISRPAAAKRLCVTERSVDRAVRLGQLRAVRVGGRVLIVAATVEALLASDAFSEDRAS